MVKHMEPITEDEWPSLLEDNHIVVAAFFEAGQPDCEKMEKILDREFYPGLKDFDDTILVKILVKDNSDIATTYEVESVPTLMIFHHGEEVKHLLPAPDPKSPKVDRIMKPFKGMGKELLDLVLDLHDPAKL